MCLYPWNGWMLLDPIVMLLIVALLFFFCMRSCRKGHFSFPCCQSSWGNEVAEATRAPDRENKVEKE